MSNEKEQKTERVPTSEIWEKHFGKVASVNLSSPKVVGFFEELNEVCTKEIEQERKAIELNNLI